MATNSNNTRVTFTGKATLVVDKSGKALTDRNGLGLFNLVDNCTNLRTSFNAPTTIDTSADVTVSAAALIPVLGVKSNQGNAMSHMMLLLKEGITSLLSYNTMVNKPELNGFVAGVAQAFVRGMTQRNSPMSITWNNTLRGDVRVTAGGVEVSVKGEIGDDDMQLLASWGAALGITPAAATVPAAPLPVAQTVRLPEAVVAQVSN